MNKLLALVFILITLTSCATTGGGDQVRDTTAEADKSCDFCDDEAAYRGILFHTY